MACKEIALSVANAALVPAESQACTARERRRWSPRGERLRTECLLRGSPGRQELEAFVARAFSARHEAHIRSFMPELVSFSDSQGQIKAVAGLREAGRERLFLEQYLEIPIESAIASVTGTAPSRAEIVEVGNLATHSRWDAMRAATSLPGLLLARDFRWIVFTATAAVQQILKGLGAPLTELARAESHRLSDDGDYWGRYYATDPRVFAGYLPDSLIIPGFQQGGSGH